MIDAIELVEYNGREYYGIHTKLLGSVSKSSERRGGNRITLELEGQAIVGEQEVEIHAIDISETGFAFASKEKFANPGDVVTVKFKDEAKKTEFNVVLDIRILRGGIRGDQYFNAGIMTNKPHDLLAYIYFKRLDQKLHHD